MSTSQRSRKQSHNAASDHYVSPLAHHLEEIVVHMAAIQQLEISPRLKKYIARMSKNLAVLHRNELNRRGF